MNPERCFACNRALARPASVYLSDRLSDGRQYEVSIGPECFKHVEAAGDTGYQPPLGGPRMFLRADDAARHSA